MFIGEGPGAEEDRQGLPFVGRSGKLLDRLLARGAGHHPRAGLHRQRREVPAARQPGPEARRDRRLPPVPRTQQLDLIRPAVVVTLGRFAAQWLLETTEGITKLRGGATRSPRRADPHAAPGRRAAGRRRAAGQMRADFVRAKLALADGGGWRCDHAAHDVRRQDTRAVAARSGLGWPVAGDLSCWPASSAPARRPSPRASRPGLGVPEPVTSPTFTLVHTYEGRLPLHHARRLPARAARRGGRPRPRRAARRGDTVVSSSGATSSPRPAGRLPRGAPRAVRRGRRRSATLDRRGAGGPSAGPGARLHRRLAWPRGGPADADPRASRPRPQQVGCAIGGHEGVLGAVRGRPAAGATPRRWRPPSSFVLPQADIDAGRDQRRRRRRRSRAVHRHCGSASPRPRPWPTRCGCR